MIRQNIYNQAFGYQTFKQNLQAHTYTQSNKPSNWKLYSATQKREEEECPWALVESEIWSHHPKS